MINYINKFKKFFQSRQKGIDISYYFKLPYVLAYPKSATVEITNLCNLNCPVCEGRNISVRKKGNMDYGSFKIILDEIGPHLYDLELHNWGEPFINKDIYKMIMYARGKAPDAYIYMDTNGHFIDTEQLFTSPPDELVFSIDGLDQKTYEKYRVNGNLEKVLGNLRNCVDAKKNLKTNKPRLVFKFICMKHNEHQLDLIPEFSKNIGADDYRIELFTSRSVEHAKEFMSTIPQYQKYDPAELERGLLVPYMRQLTTPCSAIWTHANIYWNGDVSSCCLDYNSDYSWGNIFKKGSFWKVWNSKQAIAFRNLHRKLGYRSRISICRDCYLTNYVFDDELKTKLSFDKSGRSISAS